MARRFTIQQAEALLPEVESAIRLAISLKAACREAESEFGAITRKITMAGGSMVDREKLLAVRARRDAAAGRLQEAIDEIQQLGCLVKDLDIGLIDFPTLFQGREVCLCWKVGEPGIEFWHGVDEGFRGRKKIDQDFLDNHRGDAAPLLLVAQRLVIM